MQDLTYFITYFFSKKNPVQNEATYSMLNSMETVLVYKKHLKGGVNTVQQLFCGLRSEAEQHSTLSLTTQWRQDKRSPRYATVY